MKIAKLIMLCLISSLVVSCAKKVVVPPIKNQVQLRSTKTFSEVSLEGDLNLVIKPTLKGSRVSLKGDSRDLPFVSTTVKNNMLTVFAPNHIPKHGPVTVEVSATQLNKLAYNGDGWIRGKGLRSSMLDLQLYINGKVDLAGRIGIRDLSVTGKNTINIKGISSRRLNIVMNGKPDVKLQGMANIQSVKYAGDGKLSLFWVNSPDLEVMGFGSATVNLAGVAHYLHAVTHNHAQLDARYLRINKAYIKARDNSVIRLVPLKELNAVASDFAHIYYYNSPNFTADHMMQNGAVLNMVRYK